MVTEVLGSNESGGLEDEILRPFPGGPGGGACTQVVALMYNPDTGDVVRATDGCEIESLRKSGYTTDVPPGVAEDYYGLGPGGGGSGSGGGGSEGGSGGNGGDGSTDQGGDTGAQSASIGIGLIAALGAGALYLSQ
ncbi:hypothetical protein GGP89_002446 [Salinibacter ruber]|uniref:Uncharacterized protein n=1 Tax=Salinibacter ruber TaxID=146919 RepID=A0A9X2RD39_9BACT|nr:hypothetical protein [Salinibacter ruber]MCS3865869.1 hypothetical protein [Salinibacter ruber]